MGVFWGFWDFQGGLGYLGTDFGGSWVDFGGPGGGRVLRAAPNPGGHTPNLHIN